MPVIIWIYGGFGAGKTTLAEELHRRLPDAVVYRSCGRFGVTVGRGLEARHPDRDVKRASIDLDLTAQTVPDTVPRRRDNGTTATGIRKRDTSQVAQGVRDCDGHVAHHDTRAGPSAGGAELRRYRCEIPVNGLSAALPSLHISSFFQLDAGTGIALGIPAEPTQDPLAGCLAPVCWQQLEQSPLVLVKLASGLSHDLQTS